MVRRLVSSAAATWPARMATLVASIEVRSIDVEVSPSAYQPLLVRLLARPLVDQLLADLGVLHHQFVALRDQLVALEDKVLYAFVAFLDDRFELAAPPLDFAMPALQVLQLAARV
jgi:hypothetical protein